MQQYIKMRFAFSLSLSLHRHYYSIIIISIKAHTRRVRERKKMSSYFCRLCKWEEKNSIILNHVELCCVQHHKLAVKRRNHSVALNESMIDFSWTTSTNAIENTLTSNLMFIDAISMTNFSRVFACTSETNRHWLIHLPVILSTR